jgi:hypothetical protein
MRSPLRAMTLLDNFRGDGGNGGIIRSPLSVSILLDHGDRHAEPARRNHVAER